MCLGRHPLQNPHYINPEIGKLSKSVVEKIPLVFYIPAPPNGEKASVAVPQPTHITTASADHSYPPNLPPPPPPPVPKRRFTFLRVRSSKSTASVAGPSMTGDEKTINPDAPPTWEDSWERGEYPFVRLEGNRAACAICLMDFEEPKRVASEVIKSWASTTNEPSTSNVPKETIAEVGESSATPENAISEVRAEEGEESNPLHLADAGEGAQPLRLLPCEHVFHVRKKLFV